MCVCVAPLSLYPPLPLPCLSVCVSAETHRCFSFPHTHKPPSSHPPPSFPIFVFSFRLGHTRAGLSKGHNGACGVTVELARRVIVVVIVISIRDCLLSSVVCHFGSISSFHGAVQHSHSFFFFSPSLHSLLPPTSGVSRACVCVCASHLFRHPSSPSQTRTHAIHSPAPPLSVTLLRVLLPPPPHPTTRLLPLGDTPTRLSFVFFRALQFVL